MFYTLTIFIDILTLGIMIKCSAVNGSNEKKLDQ